MYENFPYSNFHDLNTDWLVKKVKDVETSEANAKASEENAKASELEAKASELSAMANAQSAEQSADIARESASDAQGYAIEASQTVANTLEQIDLLQARVDNIIPSGTQTEGNTELLDIRVGYNGVTYSSAGNAVRGQAEELNDRIEELKENVGGVYSITDIGSWAQGGLSQGVFDPSIYYRLSTITPIYFENSLTVSVETGRRLVVHTVTSSGEFISDSGWIAGDSSYTIPSNTYVMMMISATASTTAEELDIHATIEEFAPFVTYEIETPFATKEELKENVYPSYKYNMFSKVLFIGDSVTAGFVVEGTQENPQTIYRVMPEYAYPIQFNKIHDQVNITIKARTGYSVHDWYDEFYNSTDFSEYDLIIIELGYNAGNYGYLNMQNLQTEGTNAYLYNTMVGEIREQNPDAEIILVRSSWKINTMNWLPVLTTIANNHNGKVIDLTNTKYLNLDTPQYHGYYNNGGIAEIDYAHFTRKGYNAKAYVVSRLIADKI